MREQKTKPGKLLIACRDNDERAKEALRLAAATLTVGSGLRYIWRRESACLIGRVELDAPTFHPVFLIGLTGMDFSSFEGRNGCLAGRGVLLATRGVVEDLAPERPKGYFRTGTMGRPVHGLKRAIVMTASKHYDDGGRKDELMRHVADAVCGAVKTANDTHRFLFARQLRLLRVESEYKEEAPEATAI